MKRVKEIIFFDQQGIVEVRSQPFWIKALEFWFVWWDEIFFCRLDIERFVKDDPYYGKPLAYAWWRLHMWLANHDVRIDEKATFRDHVTIPCDDCYRTDGTHDWEVEH